MLQVYERLQKLGLCLSHASTINLIDKLGVDFDITVRKWKAAAEVAFVYSGLEVI